MIRDASLMPNTGWLASSVTRSLDSRTRVEFPDLSFDVHFVLAEVVYQADILARGDEVVHQLHLMCGGDLADRLELENHKVFDNHVGDKLTHDFAFVMNGNRLLADDAKAGFAEFDLPAFLMHGFEEAEPHLVVDPVGTTDDLLC